jgi:succinate dehydrogenase hydrophobic anchor subunit
MRYFPGLASIIILGAYLLAYRDLDEDMRNPLLLALTLYAFGNIIICHIHLIFGIRRQLEDGNNYQGLPIWFLCVIFFLYILWFVIFGAYVLCRLS